MVIMANLLLHSMDDALYNSGRLTAGNDDDEGRW